MKNSLGKIVSDSFFFYFLGHKFFDYFFTENGLESYRNGIQIEKNSFLDYLGNENYTEVVSFILVKVGEMKLPRKRSGFTELRTGLLNVSPIGRDCTFEERKEFEAYDEKFGIRNQLCSEIEERFHHLRLKCRKWGQIYVDISPEGWDKSYCLRNVIEDGCFEEVHFFGDRIEEGGNDYEIGNHPGIYPHSIQDPKDTMDEIIEYFF